MNLLTVDESAIQNPQPCDLRTGPEVQHVHANMVESIAMYTASATASAQEVATLTRELAAAEKAVAALRKINSIPANVAAKLSHLSDRLAEAVKNEDVQVRILAAKKQTLAIWLGQGDPTNASLIESDGLIDKALDSVRNVFRL